MAEEKKYYWIKIKDSFMTSDKVDFLMSQDGGANYIVLYQMLCLMTLNTNGELSRKIGEVIIPFDVDKITRDCKYFEKDTVIVALDLFKRLGMIYQETNGTLVISEFDNMVGSSKQDDHTKKLAAERQAKFRQKSKQKAIESVTVTEEVTDDVTLNRNTDIRDKILDNSISINTNTKELSTKKRNSKTILFDRVDEYTNNTELRNILKQYLQFKLSHSKNYGLEQWNIQLDLLKQYSNGDDKCAIKKVEYAFSANYQSLVYPNELIKKNNQQYQQKKRFNPNLDNPANCL